MVWNRLRAYDLDVDTVDLYDSSLVLFENPGQN